MDLGLHNRRNKIVCWQTYRSPLFAFHVHGLKSYPGPTLDRVFDLKLPIQVASRYGRIRKLQIVRHIGEVVKLLQ